MRKLFSSESRHIFRSKLFWLEVLFFAVFSVWIMLANYSPEFQASENPILLDNVFFNMCQIMSLAFAVFVSLTVGTEYSDGVIRNKLVIGHTKKDIYFSTLLLHICVSALLMVIHAVVSSTIGYFLFGGFQMEFSHLLYILFCAALANLVFTTLFVGISMNCSSKAVSAVSTMVLCIAIVYVAGFVRKMLMEPEMTYDGIVISADGGMQLGEIIKNPAYVSGTVRRVYEFFYDLIPTGQLIQIQEGEFAHCAYWPIFSVVLFLAITAISYLCFKKKDIK